MLLNTGLGSAYNQSRGVGIQSSWNTIRFNTISGVDNGITVGDPFESGSTTPYVTNSFSYNKIGTDPTGTMVVTPATIRHRMLGHARHDMTRPSRKRRPGTIANRGAPCAPRRIDQ